MPLPLARSPGFNRNGTPLLLPLPGSLQSSRQLAGQLETQRLLLDGVLEHEKHRHRLAVHLARFKDRKDVGRKPLHLGERSLLGVKDQEIYGDESRVIGHPVSKELLSHPLECLSGNARLVEQGRDASLDPNEPYVIKRTAFRVDRSTNLRQEALSFRQAASVDEHHQKVLFGAVQKAWFTLRVDEAVGFLQAVDRSCKMPLFLKNNGSVDETATYTMRIT